MPGARKMSPREKQTLVLVLAGMSDKEIAAHLGISRFTVNQYTKALYRSCGVHSRTALLAQFLRAAFAELATRRGFDAVE